MLIAARNGFLVGKRLPYDAEVEYLEFTGTQYIDTGFKANTVTTRFECTLTPLYNGISGNRGGFGSRNNAVGYGSCNVFLSSGATISSSLRMDWCFAGAGVGTAATLDNGEVFHISITRGECWVNDTHYTLSRPISSNDSVDQVYNFLIGTFNNAGSPYPGATARFGKAVLYSNNAAVRDLIPVRVGTTGAMYDRLGVGGMNGDGTARNDGLYFNRGTGDFIIGPDK